MSAAQLARATSPSEAILIHRIAARTAVTDIASHGTPLGDEWYDVSQATDDEALDLAESVQYLDLYGLLKRRSKSKGNEVQIRFGRRYPGGRL